MFDFFDAVLFEQGNFKITIWSLAQVLLIYVFTKLALRFVRNLFVRITKRRKLDPGRQLSVFTLLSYLVWTISILTMIGAFGIKPTFLLASSAALLVGLGLGLQQIFQDVVSGVFLLFEGTIEIGDVLEVDGMTAKVQKINLRTSQVLTRDGVSILVPNHKFITQNVINWTHAENATRFHVTVGVSYDSNLEEVRKVLYEAAALQKDIIQTPKRYKTLVRLIDFGDSAVVFEVLFWSYEVFWVENTKSDLRFTIGRMFRENNIGIPFPQRDLHIRTMDGVKQAMGGQSENK